jgi:hypothetical protein
MVSGTFFGAHARDILGFRGNGPTMEQGGFGLQMVGDGRQRFLLPKPIPLSLLCAPKEGLRQMGMTIGLERGVEHGWLEFLPSRHRHQGRTHRAQVWEA